MAREVDGQPVRDPGQGGAGEGRVWRRVQPGGLSAAAGPHRPRPQPAAALPALTLPCLAAGLLGQGGPGEPSRGWRSCWLG